MQRRLLRKRKGQLHAALLQISAADANASLRQRGLKGGIQVHIHPVVPRHDEGLTGVDIAPGHIIDAAMAVFHAGLPGNGHMTAKDAHRPRAPFAVLKGGGQEGIEKGLFKIVQIFRLARQGEQLVIHPHPMNHIAGLGTGIDQGRAVGENIVKAHGEKRVSLVLLQQIVQCGNGRQVFFRARHPV